MCGICGFLGRGNRDILEAMVKTMHHRGPDSKGIWYSNNIYLGMRRLAIIDLETGQQPVFNEDHSICVVFNGEIYNYIELKDSLIKKGHKFSTDHSDTETIVHLYEEYGEDFLHHLNGMFAIAIWDENKKQLLLARDRTGIKPLYYAKLPSGGLVFGSEPKALLMHPEVSREPNFIAFHHYFSFKNIPAPLSAFKKIEQFHPGEMGIFKDGNLTKRRWWHLQFNENHDISENEAAIKIYNILEDSVRLHIRSDVPFGAYLSGGVDSSSIVCLMHKLGCKNIDTFTMVYEDNFQGKSSDRHFARQISKQCNTNHHEHLIVYKDIPNYIDEIISSFDEPFSGVISTFFITQSIAKYVKVALSGDGADEIFGSYKPHRLAFPLHIQEYGGNEDMLKPYENNIEELKRILLLGDEAVRRMDQYISNDTLNRALYSEKMINSIGNTSTEDFIRKILNSSDTTDPLNRALFLDFKTLLPDQVLSFVDRLSMAFSVEVRPPFLDHRLVEFAATLPGSMKIKNGRVKHILKEAVKDLLPQELLNRPKEGFLMPINEWILERLEDYVRDILSKNRLDYHGIFRTDAINQLLDEHYSKTKNHGNRIWNILMFQLWWEKYII